MVAWRYEISLLVLKKIFHSFAALTRKYFSTLEEKFRIAARPCDILYICFKIMKHKCKNKEKRFSSFLSLHYSLKITTHVAAGKYT